MGFNVLVFTSFLPSLLSSLLASFPTSLPSHLYSFHPSFLVSTSGYENLLCSMHMYRGNEERRLPVA